MLISIFTKKKLPFLLLLALCMIFTFGCGNSEKTQNDKFNSALIEITDKDNPNTSNIDLNISDSTDNSSSGTAFDEAGSSNDTSSKTPSSDVSKEANTDGDAGTLDSLPDTKPVVIVLDPGHGGIFGGAYFDGRREEIMTLKVAMYAKAYLEENYQNVEVYLTRETNTELSKDLKEELEMRAIFAKEKNADALVSLHFNASEKHDINGATVYISRRPNVHDACNELAESILQELLALGLKRQGVLMRKSNDMFDEEGEPYDYYAINRHCANRDLVGIIVEHCFMDNSTDIKYLDTEDALKKLGEADAIGIAKYYMLETK